MKFNEEKFAKKLLEALDKNNEAEKQHQPFLRMAKALEKDAADSQEMNSSVMEEQKAHLMQMAKNLKANNMQNAQKGKKKEKNANKWFSVNKPWYVWAGGLAVTAAILLAVFVSVPGQLNFGLNDNQEASFMGKAKLSVVIPAAHAGDAFNILVEKGDKKDAAVDTAFKIESKVDVDVEDLKQSLRIVNAAREKDGVYVDFEIKKQGDKEFVITPVTDLDPGEVYKVSIAAAVSEENEQKPREFSWAIQTQDKFRVLRSVPGNKSTYVPVDTSIEVTMSKTGWNSVEDYFEISPAVSGRFETHGRTLVFVPDNPLQKSTIYTVVFKKGWGLENGLKLENDVVIKFETTGEELRRSENYFHIYKYLFESSLQKDVVIPVNISDNYKDADIAVTGYAITMDQAVEAVKKLQELPYWSQNAREKSTVLSDLAVHEVFNLQTKLEESDSNWMDYLRLPAQTEKGWYVVKISPDAEHVEWILLQKSDLAAYSMVSRDELMVWAVNRGSSKPVSNMEVSIEGQKVRTDNNGVARLQTPDAWRTYFDSGDATWFNMESPNEVIRIGNSQSGLVLPIQYNDWYWYYMGGDQNEMNYWSYIYPDRPLYNLTDKMYFYGFLQNRDSGEGAGLIQVELRANEMDYSTYRAKVVARAEIQTDNDGFFDGELSWNVPVSQGFYSVVLVKDGKDMESRVIEIRDVIKPAYKINVTPEKGAVFAGQSIRGSVNAEFFDGTPYSRLDVVMETYGAGENEEILRTDDGGAAYFDYQTDPLSCRATVEGVYCEDTDNFSIDAYPQLGEEAEIKGEASVTVWRGKHNFESRFVNGKDNKAEVEFNIKEVNINQAAGEEASVLGEGVQNATVNSEIFEVYWDQIEDGTVYDPIEKKVRPKYRYERRFEPAGKFVSRTDASGKATLTFAMKEGVNYRVLSTYLENGKIMHADMTYVWNEYARASYSGYYYDDYVSLKSVRGDNDSRTYKMGEEVDLRLTKDGDLLATENSAFLFVRASRGIKSITPAYEPKYKFNFSENDSPNVAVYAIVYTPEGFEETQYHASLDTETKKLNIELSTDKDSYAPGGQIKVRVKVTDPNGDAVRGAKVAVSVVDEALLQIANMNEEPKALQSIYDWVPNGILATNWSHQNEEKGPGGGAEMGGGEGLGAIRKDFKNTAAFMVLETGFGGDAEKTFTAPDNITSWRFMAAAVSKDKFAGESMISVPVTKQLFVDAVIPQSLLVKDKPTLKVRSHGAALPSQGEITYVIDIPTLGIDEQEVKGQAQEPVYLAIDNLVKGKHKAIIGVKAGGKVDAIERTVEVVQSRSTHEERTVTELGPGVALPDPGVSSEVKVTFESKAKAQKRAEVWSLANPWSARLEAQLAGVMMRSLYQEYYGDEIEEGVSALLAYQQPDGGLSILPYASSEVALSSKAATAHMESFDSGKLVNYFWEISDDQSVTREEAIDALAGLAAAGEPVLERLYSAMDEEDLNWREKLSLMRGLEEAGDREASRVLLDEMLESAEEYDGQMMLKVSEDVSEEIEATVQAAAMAAVLAHPDANKLMAYVDSIWNHEAMTDLDRAVYLDKIVPTLSNVDVKIGYAIGQETAEIDLSEWPYHTISLLPQEVAQFRVTSVNGPAAASFLRRLPGDITESSPLLTISRTYSGNLDSLKEGDNVDVNLKLTWDARAQDGCYIVRDRLPGTMMPLVNVSYSRWQRLGTWYPHEVRAGEVSFVVCKSEKPLDIKYTARVVALGEYYADGAIIQSMQVPGLAATSDQVKVNVK